ncbi:MAG: hypothetical protein ABSC45_13465 [Desulfobaccales bacterium]|jgi:hypothetical protein
MKGQPSGIVLKFPYDNDLLRFDVEYRSGQYIIFLQLDKVTPYPVITTLLERLGFAKDDSFYINSLIKKSPPDLIENTVLELAKELAATPNSEQNND